MTIREPQIGIEPMTARDKKSRISPKNVVLLVVSDGERNNQAPENRRDALKSCPDIVPTTKRAAFAVLPLPAALGCADLWLALECEDER